MAIELLPPEVAAKIAAGEVIERPASVVKELLENSIDAGARDVRVEIREGGIRSIRVSDDGCGIPVAEADTAFLRHATSKLRTVSDLERISTLGFRGEALASIAAVSQVTLLSRTLDEEVGARLRLDAGEIVQRGGQGAPVGTSLTIENLFFNIPARRKFLRSEATETAHILTLVTRYALAWPHLRLSLIRDGRLVFQSAGTGRMMDVILKLYDLETARGLFEFGQEMPPDALPADGGIDVWGYASLPALNRGDRTHLTLFVNRRWVQDKLLVRALVDAYHGLLPTGRFPIAFLHVLMEPADLDVNVHPTKAEIRFRRSGDVFTAAQRAVRTALAGANPVRPLSVAPQAPRPDGGQSGLWAAPSPSAGLGRLALDVQQTAWANEPATPAIVHGGSLERPVVRNLPPLRVLGQLSQTYIIAEGPVGLFLIDQHTAHERVLYERFKSEELRNASPRQQLLTPLTVDLSPVQATALAERGETLASLGFEIEPFGGETILVRSIPPMLNLDEVSGALSDLADRLIAGASGQDLFEEALRTLVCHSAVRAGKTLSHEEMCELIHQLEATALPHTCPHGRPIFLHLSTERVAVAFGRP